VDDAEVISVDDLCLRALFRDEELNSKAKQEQKKDVVKRIKEIKIKGMTRQQN
jgi:hypothetical protein